MDENNNITPNPSTNSKSGDYTIGGASDYTIGTPATPVAETAPATEPTPVTPVAETTPAVEPTPVIPSEPTPQAASNTANIYEQANQAATNPAANKVEETPIYTTSNDSANTTASKMDSYSVPVSPTYASTDSTYSNTYNSTYDSTAAAPESKGLSIASLICGIVSIILSCCCCGNILFSIAGIICGCLQKPNAEGKKPGMAVAGIITSIVGIVLVIIVYTLGFVFDDYLGDFTY